MTGLVKCDTLIGALNAHLNHQAEVSQFCEA